MVCGLEKSFLSRVFFFEAKKVKQVAVRMLVRMVKKLKNWRMVQGIDIFRFTIIR